MKKVLLLFGIGLMMFVLWGCDLDSTDAPGDHVYNWPTPPEDPGSIDTNCCGVTHGSVISGVSPAGGRYYWAGLVRNNVLITHGQPVFIPEGPYDSVRLEVSVSHLDRLEEGTCRHAVFVSLDSADVGDLELCCMAEEVNMISLLDYADSSCQNCCTNHNNGGLWRYSAYAIKAVDQATAVKAEIQTNWGRLCGEGTDVADTVPAHQICFAAMLEHGGVFGGPVRPRQAQVGWAHARIDTGSGYLTVLKGLWTEVSLTPDLHRAVVHLNYLPADWSYHDYRIELTEDTLVIFYYDNYIVDTVSAPDWKHWSMMRVSWQGEINGRETDMPGTFSNRCHFDDCQYKIAGDSWWHEAAFDSMAADQAIGFTRQAQSVLEEWGIFYYDSTDQMEIWDVNPWEDKRHTSK